MPGQDGNHTVGKSFHIGFDDGKCILGTDSVSLLKHCPTPKGRVVDVRAAQSGITGILEIIITLLKGRTKNPARRTGRRAG
jgi:hypothetical protein